MGGGAVRTEVQNGGQERSGAHLGSQAAWVRISALAPPGV